MTLSNLCESFYGYSKRNEERLDVIFAQEEQKMKVYLQQGQSDWSQQT